MAYSLTTVSSKPANYSKSGNRFIDWTWIIYLNVNKIFVYAIYPNSSDNANNTSSSSFFKRARIMT